jgi:hypothetical protein
MAVRGSARCTGSSGLGDAAAYIPAGGGPVREAWPVSRTARRRVVRRACTERVHHPLCGACLAKKSPLRLCGSGALTMALEGASGSQRARSGGAFASSG